MQIDTFTASICPKVEKYSAIVTAKIETYKISLKIKGQPSKLLKDTQKKIQEFHTPLPSLVFQSRFPTNILALGSSLPMHRK